MVDLRVFDPENDYFDAVEWWRAHEWPPVPKDALSQFGMLAFEGELKIAAGWLYLTTSSMAWMEWLVTNPDAPLKSRVIGIEYIVGRLINEAKELKASSIFVSLKSKGLIKLHKKYGFEVGDSGMTNMVYKFQKDLGA